MANVENMKDGNKVSKTQQIISKAGQGSDQPKEKGSENWDARQAKY